MSTALADLRVRQLRCFAEAALDFQPGLNVITGGNGAGKTSLLEAIYFLGRGRSFRAADSRLLIQSGQGAAELSGRASGSGVPVQLGVRIQSGGLDIHVGGRAGATAADLAAALPVEALHAEIGELVQGPPETRRRLLDWGVFHVKHEFLPAWRQFRRALGQRNALLRDQGDDAQLAAWEDELSSAGEQVDRQRAAYLDSLLGIFGPLGANLLEAPVGLRYQRGWAEGRSLREALRESRDTDRTLGYTRAGPHRADLSFQIDDERSRWRASKGQQKLLGAALVLAQCQLVAARAGQPVALVVDEPAADLDGSRLQALMRQILASPAQVFLAAITADGLPLEGRPTMFHVEHGEAKALL